MQVASQPENSADRASNPTNLSTAANINQSEHASHNSVQQPMHEIQSDSKIAPQTDLEKKDLENNTPSTADP